MFDCTRVIGLIFNPQPASTSYIESTKKVNTLKSATIDSWSFFKRRFHFQYLNFQSTLSEIS